MKYKENIKKYDLQLLRAHGDVMFKLDDHCTIIYDEENKQILILMFFHYFVLAC